MHSEGHCHTIVDSQIKFDYGHAFIDLHFIIRESLFIMGGGGADRKQWFQQLNSIQ